jgi:hypothetical protein
MCLDVTVLRYALQERTWTGLAACPAPFLSRWTSVGVLQDLGQRMVGSEFQITQLL